MIYKSALSDDEVRDVEMALGRYYGLYEWERAPTPVPSPLPTKTHEPTQARVGCVTFIQSWVSDYALNSITMHYDNDACPGIVRALQEDASSSS